MSLWFAAVAVAAFSAFALVLPRTRAGRMRVLRWVVGPLVVLGFGVNWFLTLLAEGVQENCEDDCVTGGDVTIARTVFVVVLAGWFVALVVHRMRRGGDP
jgi:hypothetical protein